MNRIRLAIAAFVVLSGLAVTEEASAQFVGRGGFGLSSSGAFYGGGCGSSLYSLGGVPVPPYFAIHPPVYYGNRVRASYGTTPFARPAYDIHVLPGYAAIPRSAARPRSAGKIVVNPHYQGETVDSAPTAQPTLKVIVNPYYRADSERVAQREQ